MFLKNALLRTIKQKVKFMNVTSAWVRFHHEQYKLSENEEKNTHFNKYIATALISTLLLAKILKDKTYNKKLTGSGDNNNKVSKDDSSQKDFIAGEKLPNLPVYRATEVAKHDKEDSFWVIYRHGVFDITKFLKSHPGGEQILNAAGLSVEPFWNVYGMHKTVEIYKLLESYRIGNLHDDDIADYSNDELWVKEPVRDKRLIVKTQKPFNAEIPAKLMIQHFDTPNELFYVRQHMPVPELEDQEHHLKVTLQDTTGSRSKEFNLEELQKLFPLREVRAALMCAGNRRTEMNKVKPVKGIDWQQGAISSAVWRGVYLRDVLVYCGLDTSNTHDRHVTFTGSDMDATGENFSASIPLAQAVNPNSRILLATHMNGKPLPKDHGYPLRVVVPGAPAFRSVKWLESIKVSFEESPSHWHQKDYRSFNASKTWETADFSTAPPIYSLPVTSAICDPADGDECTVTDGCIQVRGYAYSGGGAKILRVDISPDQGQSWIDAHELQRDDAPHSQHYAWTLWTATIPVQKGQTEIELWAKATDSNFNTQPERFHDIWNIRGVLSNAYHKIKVHIKH